MASGFVSLCRWRMSSIELDVGRLVCMNVVLRLLQKPCAAQH